MKFKNTIFIILLMVISFAAGSLFSFNYHSNVMAGEHITNAKILLRTRQDLYNQHVEDADETLSILINGKIRALEVINSTFSLSDSYEKALNEIKLQTKTKGSKE